MILESILTCTHCNFEKSEVLEENISPTNFRCESCQQVVKTDKGECCIYCQYGDCPCLYAQVVGSACCNGE